MERIVFYPSHRLLQLTLAAFFGLLISGLGGYWLGHSNRAKVKDSALANLEKQCVSLDREGADPYRTFTSGVAYGEYLSILEKNHLEEKDRKLSSIFPHTEVGSSLIRVLTLLDFGPSGTQAENHIVKDELLFLQRQAEETLREVQFSIQRLGQDFESERLFLISFVAQLELTMQEKIDFLLSQLGTKEEGKSVKYIKLVALNSLIQLDADLDSIEKGLREGLGQHADYSARVLLLGAFESKFPYEARRLRSDFGI